MPIKRNEFLKPISREHHHGLLLCWIIKTGLKNKVGLERIKRYTDWFFKNHLLAHFDIEEKYIFPILGDEHEYIIKALIEHRRLKQFFESSEELHRNLTLIQVELENHIRFEERILFNEIQLRATIEQLQQIKTSHSDSGFLDDLTDPFWL